MLDTPPVPHRCRRGSRCPDRQRLDDGTVLGALIPSFDGLCVPCQRHLATALVELPRDYVELDLQLGCTTSVGGQLVSGTRELPIPIRLSTEALQAEIHHEIACWAESVAEVRRITWDSQQAGRARPGVVIQRGADLLSNSVSVLLALRGIAHIGAWVAIGDKDVAISVERDGLDGAILLLDLHLRARATLGVTRKVDRLPDACPECEREALKHPDGGDIVTCAACGEWWTWDEYKDLQAAGDSGLAVAA